MPAISRPKLQFIGGCPGRNQGVGKFDVMALRILSQIVSREHSDFHVDRNALDRRKERIEDRMLMGPDPMPKFSKGDRRTE